MWLERLEHEPFFMEEWLTHQRRDEFWQHGSISENFGDVEIPALVLAGWADGYRNTPLMAVEGLGEKAKALVGPWVHKYPHFAWPKPRTDFHSEAIAWWNKWLRGEDNGIDKLPQTRAYILDAIRPAPRRDFDPGFWVAKDVWTAPEMQCFYVEQFGKLTEGMPIPQAPEHSAYLRSPLDTGTSSGEYFTLKPDAEMALDQRSDDAGSLIFDTMPLGSDHDYLGRPVLTLSLRSPAKTGNLCARLVDVHPDGTATRVAFGVINLTHKDSNADPQPLVPGETVSIRLQLDACGYRFRKGHRIRLAISTAYWPMILPPPDDLGVEIDIASLGLGLPLLGDHRKISIPEPENPDPLPKYIEHAPSVTKRQVLRDLSANRTDYRIHEDTGLFEHPDAGLSTRQLREETWSITPGDPLSMAGTSTWTCDMRRLGWFVRTVSTAKIGCTASEWVISAVVTAYEGDVQVFEKVFAEKRIPRDLM
jgi:predicted acyl esterase